MDATETTIYHAVVICSLIIGVLLLFYFVSIIMQQLAIAAWQKNKELRDIARLEAERSEIAADFHDELGPLLSAIKFRINSFDLHDQEDITELERTNENIDDVIDRIRHISFNMMPASLLKEGIFKSIENYIDHLKGTHSIQFCFIHEQNFKLQDEKIIHLYRAILEIIHNAIKHSEATEIKIEIKNELKKANLIISDNGTGFDYKREIEANQGIGLASIRNRVMMAGGTLFFKSVPREGCEYMIEIPLELKNSRPWKIS